MLEFLMYYTSGFWTWAGITVGLGVIADIIRGALK